MRHDDRPLETVAQLIEALKDYSAATGLIWFRGHARSDWALLPSIARKAENLKGELTHIKLFKQSSRPFLDSIPTTEWEWIFLMQHHRAFTRLLDWTENALVGLYFALFDKIGEHETEDGVLWMLDPVALNVSAGYRRAFPMDVLAFDIDDLLNDYLPDQVEARRALKDPAAAIGPRNSQRMASQQGVFTIMHAAVTAIDAVGDQKHIWRMIIPAGAKAELRKELQLLGINEIMLFPDLDSVASVSRRHFE